MLFIIKSYDFNSYKHKINKQKQNKIHNYLLRDLCNFTCSVFVCSAGV